MAELPNSDIHGLPEASGFGPDWELVIQDPVTLLTQKIKVSTLTPAGTTTDITWLVGTEYDEDNIVSYGGKIWQSLQDTNEGNIPTEGVWWTELSKSPSGFVHWQAGVYLDDEVYVLNELDELVQLYRLNPAEPRPFVSSDFNDEWAAGKWELMSERGYLVQTKAAHGFVVDNVLTISGGWELTDGVASPMALVREVIDVNNFIIAIFGSTVKGFTGLTPWATYYDQGDGTYDTVVTDKPIFIAISATQIIILAGGSSGGTAAGTWVMKGDWDASTNHAPSSGDATVKQGYTYENGNFTSTTMLNWDGDLIRPYATARALDDNPGDDVSDRTKWKITY